VEVAGDAQSCTLLLRAVTTSVSPRTLTGDGAAPDVGNCVNIPTGYAYTIEATLEGKDFSGTGNIASVVGIRGVLYRAMGSAIWSLGSVGTAQGVGTAAALLPELSADTTNQCLNLSVTPPDGNTWHWVARVKTVEVR
jgi:hypothetical protein